jgi:tRNA-modifying protein YgfZ
VATAALPEIDGQYRQLREAAGWLERPRGVIAASGQDAADYLQGQLTNDIERLEPGQGCYAALLDRKGHMQADMRVLCLGPGEIRLDLEPDALGAALRHLDMYKIGREVEVSDVSREHALITVIGPGATEAVGLDAPLAEDAHRESALGAAACRTVGTALGVDLFVPAGTQAAVAEALARNGAAEVSEEAAEIARVEAGLPRFGAEMTAETIPAEAGIVERAVDFEKGCYIGQETVARLHYKGKPNRHLRGLRLSEPAAAGDALRLGDRDVGVIGTACVSPVLGPIGLAIVRREASPGDELQVGDGGIRAEVIDLPFAPA